MGFFNRMNDIQRFIYPCFQITCLVEESTTYLFCVMLTQNLLACNLINNNNNIFF